jgi:CRISPR-associated protein Csm1
MVDFLIEKFGKMDKIPVESIIDRYEERYQLILADITGIQKYLYNISHKGASKSLKGRSFYLQQMLDNIAYYLLDEKLNLPITNLIYSSGGKFYILAPYTQSISNSLESVEKLLEERFLEEYDGELSLIIGKLPLTGKDFEYDNNKKEHLISEKWDDLNKIVEKNKKHKFSNNWDYNLFKPQGTDGDAERCAATGKELIKKSEILKITPVEKFITNNISFNEYSNDKTVFYQIKDNEGNATEDFISKEQFIAQKIGADLRNKFRTLFYSEQIADYSILNINSFGIQKEFKFDDKNNSTHIRHFLINDVDILNLKGNSNKGFKFYGGDWRFPDTYGDVIKYGKGIERLGVLRLDVDNLGNIFKDGLGKKATFGRIVQLSFMLDFFFSSYLNRLKALYWNVTTGIIEETGKDSNCFKVSDLMEIIYAGGDDVFIVGHWSILPDIALWINNEFKKYTCSNPNFSISGGIYLFDDKYPIYKAALEAGEFEGSAKKKERKNREGSFQKIKNGICFLDKDTPMSWQDFEKIRNQVRIFYEWLEIGKPDNEGISKKISKGLIARLYSIYEEYKTGKYHNWAKWRWRASYSLNRLGRQYKQYQKELEEFSSELFISNNTEQDLIILLNILASWTDLLTRSKEDIK